MISVAWNWLASFILYNNTKLNLAFCVCGAARLGSQQLLCVFGIDTYFFKISRT